jgi:hypothetical protein
MCLYYEFASWSSLFEHLDCTNLNRRFVQTAGFRICVQTERVSIGDSDQRPPYSDQPPHSDAIQIRLNTPLTDFQSNYTNILSDILKSSDSDDRRQAGEWELGVSLSLALSVLGDILNAVVQKVVKNNSVFSTFCDDLVGSACIHRGLQGQARSASYKRNRVCGLALVAQSHSFQLHLTPRCMGARTIFKTIDLTTTFPRCARILVSIMFVRGFAEHALSI